MGPHGQAQALPHEASALGRDTPWMSDGKTYTITYTQAEWDTKRQLVLEALQTAWPWWTGIVITGGGQCPSSLQGRIYVDMLQEDCGGCGNVIPRGYHPGGVQLWMMMENADERLLRTVVIHEFGHALGFHHEMDRPDAKWPDGSWQCTDNPVEYRHGTYLTSYYDDVSVMNYCAPRNRNGLSAGDREGRQLLYGTSKAGRWLRALPSLSLYAL